MSLKSNFLDNGTFVGQTQNIKIMEVMKDVHIGQLIKTELKRQGRTASWLATKIFCEKSNIYKLFRRKSIDLDQLMRISEALHHNFLKDCYE